MQKANCEIQRKSSIHTYWYGMVGLTSNSTHYRSFRRWFYRSYEPTNSFI